MMSNEGLAINAVIEEEEIATEAQVDVLKGDKGDKGEKGDTGAQGPQGEAGYTPVKGVDYFTNEDKQELLAGINQDIADINYEQEIQDGKITTNTNNIQANSSAITLLEASSGNKVTLSINSNYLMTLQLLNKNNEILSTATIDFPIESMVVNATYSNGILTLTLQNGNTLDVDISAIVSGLVSESTFNQAVSRLDGLITDLTTRMTTAEEEIDDIQEEQTEQDTNIQNNTDNITALLEKINYIEDLIPTGEASGENIDISNSAKYPFKEFNAGGNTVQKQYNGKNLAQPNTHTENGITLTYDEDGVYHLKGTATSTFTFKIINRVTLSGTYTFAILDRSNTNISVWFWNNTTSSTDPLLNSEHLSVTKTYSSENEIANGNISITSGVTYDYSFKVQIEQGSTVTSYEPYVGGQASPSLDFPIEIENVLGEVEVKVENKNYAINETIGGNTPVMSNFSGNYAGAVTIAVKPITGTQQVNYRIVYQDGKKYDHAIVNINADNNVWYVANYTTTKAIASIGLYFISSTGTKRTAEHIMFLKGTYSSITDADYAAHEEQITTLTLPEGMEMCKIGDYKDSFVYQGGKWYKNKVIKKRVLNGTEAWAVVDMAYTKGYYLTDNDIKANSKSTTLANALCSHAIQVSPDANWSSAASSSNFAILNGSKMIRFAMGEKVSNLEEFKSWLGENNVTIECELATPVLEEITDPTLISDLNNLKNLYSYKGATHISSNNNPSPIFEVVYRKELESIANS
jgi:hypothetical protein